MPTKNPHLSFLCEDFNEDISSKRGRVYSALQFGQLWRKFYCPYPLGEPTNFVWHGGPLSRREIDYFLLHHDSAVSSVRKFLYPGVSTHRAVFCAVELARDCVIPRQAPERKFHFKKADPAAVQLLSAHAGLSFWLSAYECRSIDVSVERYHQLVRQLITAYGSIATAENAANLCRLSDAALSGNQYAQSHLTVWFVRRCSAATSRCY